MKPLPTFDQLEEFLAREEEFFAPILERRALSDTKSRAEWAKETVRERALRISREVFERCNGLVLYGPFEGMKLAGGSWWSEYDLGSQCLGIYENHLANRLRDHLVGQQAKFPNQTLGPSGPQVAPASWKFNAADHTSTTTQHFFSKKRGDLGRIFIDIGAADGYYAIGVLASQLAETSICFETSSDGRSMINRNWVGNGKLGNLAVFGEATEATLLEVLDSLNASNQNTGGITVLVDIEGGEFELLSQAVMESLQWATIFIEIHNWVDNFLEKYSALLRRLSESHHLNVIEPCIPDLHKFPELRDLTDDNRLLLVSERRPNQMRFIQASPLFESKLESHK